MVRYIEWHIYKRRVCRNARKITIDKAPSDGRCSSWNLKLSFVETGSGHVSYIPTNETQYIGLIKSGYLIGKLPLSPGISCNKTVIVPGGTKPGARQFRSWGVARRPGSSLQESCPLARRTETPEWLPRVTMPASWHNDIKTLPELLVLCKGSPLMVVGFLT